MTAEPILAAFTFPGFDPVALQIGPLAIRWYALAYIAGLLGGWAYCLSLATRTGGAITRRHLDDFLLWATLGVVLGGRLGFVLFYAPEYYLANPIAAVSIWQGGMSFHGGLLGVTLAMVLFARARRIPLLTLADMVSAATPIGIFFGRLANFINGELWGRPADVPWAVIFPAAGPEPRHPSQLYEALSEGLILFLLLFFLVRRTAWLQTRPGVLTGVFLAGYGIARFSVEYFRAPNPGLENLLGLFTMGQLLSLPMILVGVALIAWVFRRSAPQQMPTRQG